MDRFILTGILAGVLFVGATTYTIVQMIPQWALEEAVDTSYWHTTVEYYE